MAETHGDYHKLVEEDHAHADAHAHTAGAGHTTSKSTDGDRLGSVDSVEAWRIDRGGRNVWLALWFTFSAGTARGVWSFTVLSGYLYALTGSNSAVGVAEGAQGLAQLLMALVAGVLLVRDWRRDRVLQIASAVGLVAAVGLLLALTMGAGPSWWGSSSDTSSVAVMTVALALFGSYQGVWNTGLETIYADSVPTGHRASLNTKKFVLMLLASCSGPLVSEPGLACATPRHTLIPPPTG